MVGAVESGADALDEFRSRQEASGLHHPPLGMHPLGFDGIQPRSLDGQIARDDPGPFDSRLG
jgi:hypothetical protein